MDINLSNSNRKIKEIETELSDAVERINNEIQLRLKAEKQRNDLARHSTELAEQLESSQSETKQQIETNNKIEANVSKLRQQLDESKREGENSLISLRSKFNGAMNDNSIQTDNLQKNKSK